VEDEVDRLAFRINLHLVERHAATGAVMDLEEAILESNEVVSKLQREAP
jgi:hypothetical protein